MRSTLDLRRLVLRALLAAALVAGAAALLALARGGVSETDWKTMATSLLFALASTMAAAGAAARERDGARNVGSLTIAATGLAFVVVTAGLWIGVGDDAFWRAAAAVAIVALEGAHASYVLARRRLDDPDIARSAALVAVGTAVLSGALALVPVSGLAADDRVADGYLQLIGAVLVVQVVATVVASLVRRLGGKAPERPLLAVEDPVQRLRREVGAAVDRIEHLTTDPRIRTECARLRALAGGERSSWGP